MDGVTILPFEGEPAPSIDPTAFVAPGSRIIGDVTLGAESSIWHNCVLRGHVDAIMVGRARTSSTAPSSTSRPGAGPP